MTQSDYTLANSPEEMGFFKARAEQYDLNPLPFHPGDRILDVGCGNGRLTQRMAQHVGKGWVIGIDAFKEVLPKTPLTTSHGEDLHLGFSAADAQMLPFMDETFDVTCAHTLLMHLSDAEAALGEMVRVTRMGGAVIALGEGDWRPVRSDPVCPALDRIIQLFVFGIKQNGGDPYMGHSLEALFRRSGLTDVQMKPCKPESETIAGHDLLHMGYLEMARPILEKANNGGANLGDTVENVLDDIGRWCLKSGSVFTLPQSCCCSGRKGAVP